MAFEDILDTSEVCLRFELGHCKSLGNELCYYHKDGNRNPVNVLLHLF